MPYSSPTYSSLAKRKSCQHVSCLPLRSKQSTVQARNASNDSSSIHEVSLAYTSKAGQKSCRGSNLSGPKTECHLTALPKEISDLIIEDQAFDTLKSLRLTCRYFAFDKRLLKMLYRRIVLTADRIHFREMRQLANSIHLASLVEEFEFNCILLERYESMISRPPPPLVYDFHQAWVRDMQDGTFWTDGHKSRLRYRYFAQQQLPVWSEDEEDTKFWLSNLQFIFQRLPNVHLITVRPRRCTRPNWLSEMPHFTMNRLNLAHDLSESLQLSAPYNVRRPWLIIRYISAALILSDSYARIRHFSSDWGVETEHVTSYRQMFEILQSKASDPCFIKNFDILVDISEESELPDQDEVQEFKSSVLQRLRSRPADDSDTEYW